jgi:hypothetical protein
MDWQELDEQNVRSVGGNLGVYELRAGQADIIRIGYAGSRSLFGLRGELTAELAKVPAGTWFRYEVTSSYLSRYQELLMRYKAVHKALPRDNPPERAGTREG